MKLLEALNWAMSDIISIVVIIVFIMFLYETRYDIRAHAYLKNQLDLFMSYCVTCMVFLYIYYYLENKFHVDDKYTGGIVLTLFFFVSGVAGKILYKYCFHENTNLYKPTKEEYLVITSTAFIIVTSKLVSEGIIGVVIPFALLMGRYIWLDTGSLKDIRDLVMVNHRRIVETSLLLIVGMLILSVVMRVFHLPRLVQPLIAVLYGLIILYPVEKLRKLFCR